MALKPAFFRSLAAYHRAGIGWPDAVSSAAGLRGGMEGVADRLRGGTSLADALGSHVDPVDSALLRAGEASGNLELTLERIAQTKEETARETKERWAGLAYPIVLAHVGALLLPIPDVMQGNPGRALIWAALILVPVWAWILGMRRLDAGRRKHAERPMRAWGPFRSTVEEGDARCLRVFAACLEAGVPLLEGLRLAQQVAPGSRVGQDLARANVLAQGGSSLAEAWQDLPEEHADRLRTAERVGELGQAARRIADQLLLDVRLRRKKTQAVMPIAIILVIGAIIAWRVFSFYGGLYGKLGL
ncbi:MAG: type II secretion system F family protein [Planctomycetota bacterium]|nr:type II secretion system F family protein [Planctomycetota bacterium]